MHLKSLVYYYYIEIKLNKEKTKVMMVEKKVEETVIYVNMKPNLQQVNVFQYLSVIMERKGNNEVEVNERLQRCVEA